MEFVVRFGLLSLALFALASPTFGGEGRSEIRYIRDLCGLDRDHVVPGDPDCLTVDGGGARRLLPRRPCLTFLLAISGIAASFPIGVILALGRTSTMPIFRLMSTVYIEVIRGVPLITWLLVGAPDASGALPEGVAIARRDAGDRRHDVLLGGLSGRERARWSPVDPQGPVRGGAGSRHVAPCR